MLFFFFFFQFSLRLEEHCFGSFVVRLVGEEGLFFEEGEEAIPWRLFFLLNSHFSGL